MKTNNMRITLADALKGNIDSVRISNNARNFLMNMGGDLGAV